MSKRKVNSIDEIIKLRRYLQSKFADEKTSINTPTIYHYTSPEGLLNIITTQKLWFSDIRYMNDESEITYTFKLLENIVKQYSDIINENFKTRILEIIHKKSKFPFNTRDYINRDSLFVACFSTQKDELSLWNYYTKTGSMAGYNIGFNVDFLTSSVKKKLKVMHHFIYGKTICEKTRQEDYIKEAVTEYNSLYEKMKTQEDEVNLVKSFGGLIHIFSLFFKTESFKNENEYRLVITELTDILQKHNRAFQIQHRVQNGIIIPYIEIEFDKNTVSEVITSPTIKQNYYKAGVESLLHQNEYHQTIVDTSKIPIRY